MPRKNPRPKARKHRRKLLGKMAAPSRKRHRQMHDDQPRNVLSNTALALAVAVGAYVGEEV